MKRIYTLAISLLMVISMSGTFLAQQWTARVDDISNTGNTFTFSVYVENLGPDATKNLAFLGGQWAFNFNKAVLNGGTLTGQILSGIGSAYLPKPPVVTTTAALGRIVFQANLPADGGPCIPFGESLKIFEAKFTNSVLFSIAPLELAWRLTSPSPTQISYYVTSLGNCTLNSGGGVILPLTSPTVPEFPLPVEISTFTANASQRDVKLNWQQRLK